MSGEAEDLEELKRRFLAAQGRPPMVLPPEPKIEPEIESIRRLNVKPGEVLVVAIPSGSTAARTQEIADLVRQRLPDGVEVLVATKDVDMQVVAKPRHLPLRKTAYSDSQWYDLTNWLARLGTNVHETCRVTLTDTEVTITAYRLNAEGRRYAIGDEIATTYVTTPLDDAPAWFTELAA